MENPICDAARRAIAETGTHGEVARALKRRFGWRCSEQTAVSKLSQMLNPRNPHNLPADALLDIVRITRRDEFSGLILREIVKAELEDPS